MDWLSITALVLTPLSAIIGWIVRDRKIQKQEVIKGDIDIQKEQIDLAKNTRDLLLLKEQDHKLEKEEFRKELVTIREEAKSEREYYRKKTTELRSAINTIQDKFNDISLLYTKEVEQSDLWKQKYYELDKKYIDLKKYCDGLEKKIQDLNKKVDEYEKSHQ